MRTLFPPATSRASGFVQDGDELIDDDWENKEMEVQAAGGSVNFPASITAVLKFGYERSMKNKMAETGTDFGTWIDGVMAHVQTYYKHPTLPTQIIFQVFKSGKSEII